LFFFDAPFRRYDRKMQPQFIKISGKVIRIDAISFVDFLDSGRAMVMLAGIPAEKAHVSVDVAEARVLKAYFDRPDVTVNPTAGPGSAIDSTPRPFAMRA